jgi:hypothetical protein
MRGEGFKGPLKFEVFSRVLLECCFSLSALKNRMRAQVRS